MPEGVIPRTTFTPTLPNADGLPDLKSAAIKDSLPFMPFSKGDFDLPPMTFSKFSPAIGCVQCSSMYVLGSPRAAVPGARCPLAPISGPSHLASSP